MNKNRKNNPLEISQELKEKRKKIQQKLTPQFLVYQHPYILKDNLFFFNVFGGHR